jgi:hypothetical protein
MSATCGRIDATNGASGRQGFMSGGHMRTGRFVRRLGYSLFGAFAVLSVGVSGARAQGHDAHNLMFQHGDQEGAFVKAVRNATERFRDPSIAVADGYVLQFGCVSGSDQGAMGVHFVNGPLVGDGLLDVARPEALVYEPTRGDGFRLAAVEYLVLADTWNANHSGPPELMGQLFHLIDSPNRFGLPAFYSLHVWAWKDNPSGTFVNWSPRVSCDAYNPRNP